MLQAHLPLCTEEGREIQPAQSGYNVASVGIQTQLSQKNLGKPTRLVSAENIVAGAALQDTSLK
jgi:hypothetical protein